MSLVNFFQSADLFKHLNLHWPPAFKQFIVRFATYFNFQLPNLPFVMHPECAFSLTYSQKWILEMSSPLLIMALLLTFVILRHIIALVATEMLVLMRFEKIPLLRRGGLFISKYGGFSVGRWWVPLVGAAGFWIYIAWEALCKKDVSKYLLWAGSATTVYFGLLFFVLLFAEQLDAKYSLPRKAQLEKDRLTRLHSDSPAEFVQIVSQELDRRIQQNDGKDGSSSPREQSPRASMREFLKHTESDGSNAERALLHELQELQHFDELDDEALAAAAIKLLVEPRKSNIKMRVKRILKAARDKSCFAMCNHAATFACAPAAIAIATLAALAVYHIVIAEPPNLSSNQGLGMLIVAFLCCAVILVSCLRLLFGVKSANADTIVQNQERTTTGGSNVQMLKFVGMNVRKHRTPEPEPDSVTEFELLPVQDRNVTAEQQPTELTVVFDGELRLVRSNASVLMVHHANGMHFDVATWPKLSKLNVLFDEEELAIQQSNAETIFVVIDKDDRDAGFTCSEDLIVQSATGRRVIESAVTQGMRLSAFNGRQLTESTKWMDVKNIYQIAPRPWVFEFRPNLLQQTATANPLAQDAMSTSTSSSGTASSDGTLETTHTFDELRPGMTLISIDGTDVELLAYSELADLLKGEHQHAFVFSLLRQPHNINNRQQRRRRLQKAQSARTIRVMVGMGGLNAATERTARDTFIEILCWCEDEKPFHSNDPDVGTALRKIIYFISLFL